MRATSKAALLGPDRGIFLVGTKKLNTDFDPEAFLAKAGAGKTVINLKKRDAAFSQGDPANSIFFVQKGQVRLTVVSNNGKEATIGILNAGDFFGEGALAGQSVRMGSASAMTDCDLLRIEKKAMMLVLHQERAMSDMFVAYLLATEHPARSGFSRPTLQFQ